MTRHRTHSTLLLMLCLCSPLLADEATEELRAAEIAFAATVADGDLEAFGSFIDEDAVFVSTGVLRGRAAIVQAWSAFFAEGAPQLTWQPEVVEVRADGLGLSRGPYTLTMTAPDGGTSSSSGSFTSIWRRGEDGAWKVLFDSGCPPSPTTSSAEE